jgi:hypothetical protein
MRYGTGLFHYSDIGGFGATLESDAQLYYACLGEKR